MYKNSRDFERAYIVFENQAAMDKFKRNEIDFSACLRSVRR